MNPIIDNDSNCLILCIGNRDGGDDAVGPYIADLLKESESDLMVIDCGTVPENYTSIVKKHNPVCVILVDAVKMGLNPGKIRIVPENRIGVMHISTHGIPLSVFISYLKQFVETVIFIGIQPQNMSAKMTNAVRTSAEVVVAAIKNNTVHNLKILQD